MRKIKLTRYEQQIETEAEHYKPVPQAELNAIAKLIESRRKDAVLNIRINRMDLDAIKRKAGKLGVKYQTFIGEILHRVAHR